MISFGLGILWSIELRIEVALALEVARVFTALHSIIIKIEFGVVVVLAGIRSLGGCKIASGFGAAHRAK